MWLRGLAVCGAFSLGPALTVPPVRRADGGPMVVLRPASPAFLGPDGSCGGAPLRAGEGSPTRKLNRKLVSKDVRLEI